MCDTEFTIEQGKLWMLQTRVGKRTGAAALRMAVDMTKGTGRGANVEDHARRRRCSASTAEHLDSVLHPQFAGKGKVLAKGLAASPGAAVGKVYFTADDAADAHERGEKVILVRSETSPEDVHGMMVSQGILTARGGLVSHAAVVARGWGTPAVVGAEAVKIDGKAVHRRRHDGARGRRHLARRLVRRGHRSASSTLEAAEPPAEFHTVLAWADDDPQGQARACGPTPTPATTRAKPAPSAPRASACAAPSTCSSAPDRLPVVRRMILAVTPDDEAAALEELREVQKTDFKEILEAMDGLPVTVRLLDPPLHEFLPRVDELEIKQATTGLTDEEKELLEGGRELGRVQPDARHPWRPPRRASSRASTRCRCGR